MSALGSGVPPATEAVDPAGRDLDRLETAELVARLGATGATAAAAVARAGPAIAAAVEGIAARLRAGGRLHYVGAGTSGRLATLDAAECPPTFGTDPGLVVAHMAGGPPALVAAVEGAEDDEVAGERVGASVDPRDAVVGLSASGGAPFVRAALRTARARGALTIGVASDASAQLLRDAELAIAVETGSEPLAGSTRLTAGTAQKLVLGTLSTAVMVRLGRVFENRMVDVAATNAKLRARAIGMIAELGRVDADVAAELLAAADGHAKLAIAMARLELEASAAAAVLAAHDGFLRAALDARGADA